MKKQFFSFFFMVSFLFLLFSTKAEAAILTLEPSSKSIALGQTFTVAISIDTEGETVTSTDAVLLYDSSILNVDKIDNGDGVNEPFFPDVFKNITTNEIYVGAAVRNPTDVREGRGTVATITFSGKTEGTTDVRFDCTAGKTSDTNISKSDKNATDIVECARVVNGRYTIGAGIGGITSTPYPTSIIYPTATRMPTIPVSGSTETTVGILGVGALLAVSGIIAKIILKL